MQRIYEEIWEELNGAEHYAKRALSVRSERPELAKLYFDMSNQEIIHANALADEVTRTMKAHPPAEGERAVYEFVRDMQSDKMAKVKTYQSQFK